MEDHGEGITTKIPEVDNLILPDETTENNSISSNLAMVFAKLPELLAQTKHHLDSPSTSSNHNMAAAAAAEHYISCIKINGVPILPPVLDENSKKEMRMYREEAIRRSKEREKQKKLIPTPELSVSAHSPPGNESKNYSHDSLEYSQQDTVLAEALASNISPLSHSTTGDQQVTTLEMPADSFPSDWKPTDSILNSLSDLGSLDDGSLPTQLHGIPLTSKSEQQITRDLSTLNKHLPESCRSAHPELCDLSLDLNARLPAWSPDVDTVEKCAFSFSPPPIFLTSTSSPVNDTNSNPNPDHGLEKNLNNSQTGQSPLFKAPIFLTENDGLHLTVKKQSPTSVASSPSLKANPAVNEQQWIMNSPLIAYVTKKRPKPVGMPSLSVKPKPLTKSQRVNNATFTIDRKKLTVHNVCDQDDADKQLLKRPVISTEQRSSTPVAELSNNLNNSSISTENKVSTSKLTVLSPSRIKYQPCSQSDLSKPTAGQRRYSLKLKTPEPIDKRRYTYSGTPSLRPFVNHRHTNHDRSLSDIPKVNLNDAICLASPSLSASPEDHSTKEHLGDDSLDELILGVENIGLVPRIDGDGSDVPSPLSTSKDLPISSDQKEIKQAWQKDSAFNSSGLVRANFSPVGTDSPHHLQVPVAAVDVTTSSGVASLSDISESPLKISSIASESSTHFTNSGIRRGSYTLLEPSINLAKLAQLTPSPVSDDCNRSSISERIPSYADFEIDLHKRIPSKKQSPKCATPSKLVTPIKSISVIKPFHSDPKSYQEMQPLESKSPFLKRSKSVTRIKRTKDSFHLTPPTKRNFSKCFQNEKSKKSKLSDNPQPTVAKKNSPKSFREWRLSNIDCKVSTNIPKDVENMKLTSDQSLNVSVDSPLPSPTLPSPSLINENPLDWDNNIDDQKKCFFSEKKDSYFKLKKDSDDWQEQMVEDEENFRKTFESIKLFKQFPENGRIGCDFLTPDISFTSTEPGQLQTPIKQLFVPQTPAMSSDSSPVSVCADNVRKPNQLNPVLERIPAAAKGFLTRKLLSCPKVVSLRKTMTECQLLLKEIDYNNNVDFIDRIHNQLESSRQEIHAIFFEQTVAEKMALIKQSRELRKKPVKVNQINKAPQLSYATQKYLLRKKTEKASIPNKTVSLGKIISLKKAAVSPSPASPKQIMKKKKIQTKQENQSIRKIAQPSAFKPKANNVVSVPGKMTATRIVATKAIAGTLKNNSHKPWR